MVRHLVILAAVGTLTAAAAPAFAQPTTAPARSAATTRVPAAPAPARSVRAVFDGIPLNDAIDSFREAIGVSVFANWNRIEQMGVDRNTPVTLQAQGITYGKLLSLILESASPQLRYTVHEGVITIYAIPAYEVREGPPMLTRVYDVTDLMWVIPDLDPGDSGIGGNTRGGGQSRSRGEGSSNASGNRSSGYGR